MVVESGRPARRGGGGGRAHAGAEAPTRRERSRARTRLALVQAAQRCILAGDLHVPILAITQAADVGLGSFYNHFTNRQALFAAAVDDALEAFGELLDRVSVDLADPAEAFGQSFRLVGRLLRSHPLLMQVALSPGPSMIQATGGLVGRARRDVEAGVRAGRFTSRDSEVTVGIIVGSVLCLAQLLSQQPERDAGEAADEATAALLRMLGLGSDDADRIARQALPNLDAEILRGLTRAGAEATVAGIRRGDTNHRGRHPEGM